MSQREPALLKRLLVATDGELAADSAIRVAKRIAERDAADVEVVGVFCPRIPVPPLTADSCEHRCEPRDRPEFEALGRAIEHQLRDRIGVAWPVHLCVGHPAARITELARSLRADLIVLGHTMPTANQEHRPGRHTAEQIAISCDIPILAVPSGYVALPRAIVAVDDGSAASRRALSIAAAVLAQDGTIRETTTPVGRSVLHHAESLQADLLSLPLQGSSTELRALLGGAVLDVLDHARGAVLITPSALSRGPFHVGESP
ncbi:MAG: universal stress protein [Gemmatimonadaceae bacterium]